MSHKLLNEIRNVLTPKYDVSMISDEHLYPLKPLFSLQTLRELLMTLPEEKHAGILSKFTNEGIVIYNNHIYLQNGRVNLNDRIARIFTAYKTEIQNSVQQHRALMEIYERMTPAEIAHLAEAGIVIGMRPRKLDRKQLRLCSSYYMDTYLVSYQGNNYQFPPVIIVIPIDDNLHLSTPEAYDPIKRQYYRHMFVYNDISRIGQKICLGTFQNDSTERQRYNDLPLSRRILFMNRKAEQILISGYHGNNVHPVRQIKQFRDHII